MSSLQTRQAGKGHQPQKNLDAAVIRSFGDEWSRFTQTDLSEADRERIFSDYFDIFPWDLLPDGGGIGLDLGCGSGRWALAVAPRVAHLHLVDASPDALSVARMALGDCSNVSYHHASVGALPFPQASLDFAYSLGVLHHIPDIAKGLSAISHALRPGAPFLVYLYYAFDNRPGWFRCLWHLSDLMRRGISRLPKAARFLIADAVAVFVYLPLAKSARALEILRCLPSSWPLAYYRDKSFYVMRTDALDRFGTALEKRFTRSQIKSLLEAAGFADIRFSDSPPYWCAVGIKRSCESLQSESR